VWSAENIYTPEFVLSGKKWRNWFGFRGTPAASALKPSLLQVSSEVGKHWQADLTFMTLKRSEFDPRMNQKTQM